MGQPVGHQEAKQPAAGEEEKAQLGQEPVQVAPTRKELQVAVP